jgi:two-component system chemotaxis response regulator CheY
MADEQTGTASAARPLNILIVDDSAMMRAMIKRVAGICEVPIANVYEAANGAEALQVLETHQVDALFTDINMPVMTGTELLREINRRPCWKDVTRVIISTDGSEARRAEVQDLNVKLYIEKPFRPEVMRDVLTELTAGADVR